MRIPFRSGLPLAVAVTLLAAACSESTGVSGDQSAQQGAALARPSLSISDATNSGRTGFYFLAPIVPTLPSYPGTFDPGVAATARICPQPYATCAAPLATFTVGSGITIDAVRQAYVATWPVPNSLTLGTGNYRLEVLAAGTTLGYADLNILAASGPSTPGYASAVRGGTLTIRFRIETGMVGAVTVSPPSATIAPAGTQAFTAAVTDLHGNPIASPAVAWSSSNTAAATVSPTSGTSTTATGVADGTANIVATSNGVSGQGVLTVTSNTAPVAVADAYPANAGSSITVPAGTGLLANDNLGTPAATVASYGGGSLGGAVTDHAAGATTTFGSGGSLTVNADGSFSFTPASGFTGSFTFSYRITNAAGSSDATVTISVQRAPAAVNDTYTDPLSGPLSVAAPGVMANDDRGVPQANVASFGGGDLGGTVTTNAAGASVSDGHGGTIQLNADGSLTHTPSGTFHGSITFSYRLTSTFGSSDATVTIQVPQAPSAVADAYTATAAGTLTVPASGVLANDALGSPAATITSFGGGSLGGTVTSNAPGAAASFGTGGSVQLNADGSLSFTRGSTPGNTFTFQYRLTNAFGTSDATVTITVPKAPDAVDDINPNPTTSAPGSAWHTALNTTLPFPGGSTPNLLANDDRGSPQGDITAFGEIVVGSQPAMGTVTSNVAGATVSLPDGGSLTVNADGTGSFTPGTNFVGVVTFKYRLANAAGFDDAKVTIFVGTRPAAAADDYSAAQGKLLGNVDIDTDRSSKFSVLTNDQGSLLNVTLVGGSATHGTASVQPSGKFTFNPERGYEGAASFQYQISNGLGTATATVSLTIEKMAWFIDDDAAAGGNGTFLSKYNTLAAFQAANALSGGADPDNGESIFLYSGTYTGPVALRASQKFIGQGVAAGTAASNLGVTWPTDGPTQPSVNQTKPGITATGNDVTLGSGNTLKGVALGNATGAALGGSGFGTLTTADVAINTNGQAINLATGTIDGDFAQVQSAGGTNNVLLSGVGTAAGTTTDLGTSGDALSGATSDAIKITGADGSFTYAGSITNGSTLAVNVGSKTGGTTTFSGSINPTAANKGISVASNSGGSVVFSGAAQKISTGSGAGVSLTSNTGATISFTGGALAIATTTGNGFDASGGGTVKVTGSTNAISSAGGTALRVSSTTIDASGLTFRSISANGGANGIFLSSTGTSGGLTVTGDGSTNGSGGTIQNSTGADNATAGNGVYLSGVRGVSLSWMNLNDHANNAVFATGVRGLASTPNDLGLALDHLQLTGNNGNSNQGGSTEESAVHLLDVGGTVSLKNSSVAGGAYDNLRVRNDAGTAPTLDSLVIANNTFGTMQGSAVDVRNHALAITVGDGAADVRVRDNQVNFWWGTGIDVVFQSTGSGVASVKTNSVIQSNASPAPGASGIVVDGGALTYVIDNNTVRFATGAAIAVDEASNLSSAFKGTISNNKIGLSGSANSGSSQGSGISVIHLGAGTSTHAITGNVIRQINGIQAILLQAGDASGSGGNGTLNVTVTGNNIQEAGTTTNSGRSAIILTAGTASGDGHQVCADIGGAGALGNSITNFNTASPGNDNRIRPNQRFLTTVRMPGYTGANNDNAAVATYLLGRNTASRVAASNSVASGGGGYLNTIPAGSACPQP